MIRIGKIGLGKGPAIALTVTDRDTPSSIKRAVGAPLVGARRSKGRAQGPPLLLEIRIDRFRRFDFPYVLSKINSFKRLKLPLIATIRSRNEGGARTLSDSARFELFKKVLPLVNAIDVELSSSNLRKKLIPVARRSGKRVILSYHNFASTPSESSLVQFIRKAKRSGADLVKLAVTPKTSQDLARLLRLTHRHRKENLITLAMGKLGAPSRTLGFLFGSLLTYSYLGRNPQAPGQLPFTSLLRELTLLH